MLAFLFKILLLSTLLSVAIKYGGAYLPISGTIATTLIIVLSPTILLAIALSCRSRQAKAAR